MIYSIVVWGFDTDNDYCHDCDLVEAKSFQEAFAYATNRAWQGWTFTKIEIEMLKNIMITMLMKMTFLAVKRTMNWMQK